MGAEGKTGAGVRQQGCLVVGVLVRVPFPWGWNPVVIGSAGCTGRIGMFGNFPDESGWADGWLLLDDSTGLDPAWRFVAG